MRNRTGAALAAALFAVVGTIGAVFTRPGQPAILGFTQLGPFVVNGVLDPSPCAIISKRQSVTQVQFTVHNPETGETPVDVTDSATPFCIVPTAGAWDARAAVGGGNFVLTATATRADGTLYRRVTTLDVSGTPRTPSPDPGPVVTYDWYVNDDADAGGDGSAARPFQTIGAAYSAAIAGQSIYVAAGTYREALTVAKADLTIVGETNASGQPVPVVKGSDVFAASAFTKASATWYATYAIEWPNDHGTCSHEQCKLQEQVFVNGVEQFQETTLAAVGLGEFYHDDGANQLHIGTDPAGKTVEITTRERWVFGATGGDRLTVRNLKMQHAAVKAQDGAIADNDRDGWKLENLELSYAHGTNVSFKGNDGWLKNSKALYGGQAGFHGTGTSGVLFEGNEIAYNNTQQFSVGWEAGAGKFSRSEGWIARANTVHDNKGPGLWCDIDCGVTTIVQFVDNRIWNNGKYGISFEISGGNNATTTTAGCLISGNRIWENGFSFTNWGFGAGILLQNGSNCEVTNNLLAWNADGISVIQQCRSQYQEWPPPAGPGSNTNDASNTNDNPCLHNGSGPQNDSNVDRTQVYGNRVHGNTVAVQYNGTQSYALAWLSADLDTVQAEKDLKLSVATYGNTGSTNRYYRDNTGGNVQYGWPGSDTTSIATFNGTPGEEGGTEIPLATLQAELEAAGMPVAP